MAARTAGENQMMAISPADKCALLAPLDWGLGHATRCMPLIDLLIKKDYRIIIAGNGDSLHLLKDQYPQLSFYTLPGYNIRYETGKNATVQSLLQTPHILRTISEENKIISEIAAKENPALIISDNRYGVRHEKINSILICHHVALQAPKGLRFMNPLFLSLHLAQIRKFNKLWIPDEAGDNNLSGILSHEIDFKIPHTYIGIQSRFANSEMRPSLVDDITFDTLIVLSGPEPQRTHLENELKKKLRNKSRKVLLIQGKANKFSRAEESNITTISYLNTNDMYVALQKASTIICRSGYSTVMDLAVLGKKAILIPSEGQTEQEYLADILSEKKFSVKCAQRSLDLDKAFRELESIKGFPVYHSTTKLLEEELSAI